MSQPADDRQLGEHLVNTGKLTRQELEASLEAQRQAGGPAHRRLGEILVEQGHITLHELQSDHALSTSADFAAETDQNSQASTALLSPSVLRPGQMQSPASASGSGSMAAIESQNISDELRQAMEDPSRYIGRYVMLSELGRGGMGVVYRCHDPQLHRDVAIKMLLETTLPSAANDEAGDLARFVREARAAAKLRHPGIVALHEVGDHNGRPFLVMDFVEGESFEALLKRKKISSSRTAELLRDVARAIHHAHQVDIIHRDIKPHNVIVDLKGRTHVMDFGLARDSSANHQITKTGQIMGTPAYMAPEQADANPKGQGPWTDVYALGAVLYRALTGRPPFQSNSQISLIKKVLTDDPIPPRRLRPTIPVDLETISLKCLEKDPDRRYPSAAAVADELERFLARDPILASPISWSHKTKRWIQRNQVVTASVVTAVVIGAAAMVTVSSASRKQRELEAALLEERSRPKVEQLTREEPASQPDVDTPQPSQPLQAAAAEKPAPPAPEPETAKEWMDRGVTKKKRGDHAGAIEDYTKALTLNPLWAQAWNNRGASRDEVGNAAGAIEDFTRAIEIDPTLVLAFINRGRVKGRQADLEGGTEDLNQAIELDPSNASGWGERGLLLLKQKDLDGAISDFTRAIEISPRHWIEWHRRGLAQRKLGQLEAAWSDLTRCIEINPNHAGAWNERGLVRLDQRDLKGAFAQYSKAIEIDPEFDPAWLNRGSIWLTWGETDKAIADFNRAIEINPNQATSWYNRGNARKKKKDPLGAIADYDRALEIRPNYPEATCNRANAKFDSGDREGAIMDWRRFLELAPNHQVAPSVRAQLKRLTGR